MGKLVSPPIEKWRPISEGTGSWPGHSGSEKMKVPVSASIFRHVGQWRWNRIKQGRGTSEFLLLFHEWPHLTLFPAVDTCFPLKLHVALNKWVSSESLSRTNQHTSVVSKWRVHSTDEQGDCFLIPLRGKGHGRLGSNWCSVPSLKERNCTPVTLKPHSSTWKLISFQCFPSGLSPCQLEIVFGPHTHNKWTWSRMLPEVLFLLEGKLLCGKKPAS